MPFPLSYIDWYLRDDFVEVIQQVVHLQPVLKSVPVDSSHVLWKILSLSHKNYKRIISGEN